MSTDVQDGNSKRTWPWILLAVYAVLLAPIYFLPVYVPDETWFFDDAQRIADSWERFSLHEVRCQRNHLGYGAIYWISYALMCRNIAFPLIGMRAIAFLANLSIPYLLLRSGRGERKASGQLAMLLWLSFTAAWWTGKITGPELFSMTFLFYGLLLSICSRSWRGPWVWAIAVGLLLGLAVGLKMNAAFVVPIVMLTRPFAWRSLASIATLALGLVGGFLLANPFILDARYELFGGIADKDVIGTGVNLQNFFVLMWNTDWEWDAVFVGGFLNWGFSPLTIPFLCVFLYKYRRAWDEHSWKWSLGIAGCLALTCLAYLYKSTFWGWYWLPLLLLFPLSLLRMPPPSRSAYRWGLLVIAVNFLGNLPWIGMQYYSKVEQFAHQFDRDRVVKEAEKSAATTPSDKLLAILDNRFLSSSTEPLQAPNAKFQAYNARGMSYLKQLQDKKIEFSPGEVWLLIHDNRLRRYESLQKYFKNLSSDYEISILNGKYVTVVQIRHSAHNSKNARRP